MYATESDIKKGRKSHKIPLYFTLSIVLLVLIWSIASQLRWVLFNSGSGDLNDFDYWILVIIGATVALAFSFFTLGQYSKKLSKECSFLGGTLHFEERQVIYFMAIIIGTVLGMGFWDIVTMIHLAMIHGILNIGNINVVVFDFGIWQMVIPVWGLIIIGIVKMGAVLVLYALALKNIKRGTICELATLDRDAILN